MRELHTEKFDSDTISAVLYGRDYQIKINGRDYGVYTSLEAGIKAAKESIKHTLSDRN